MLGPIRVSDGGRPIDIGPKESIVLARLVAARGRVVPDDTLLDAVWPHPPPSARKTLHGYIHRLRRAMGADAVVRHRGGYAVGDIESDVEVLGHLVALGRRCVSDDHLDDAVDAYQSARALFRGRPLPELDDDVTVAGLRRQLEELEFDVSEELCRTEIARGRAAEIIGDLEQLVAIDPTRESAWYLLAEACARDGRLSDGMAVVARARRALAIEVGLELGPQFGELEQAILEHRIPVPHRRWDVAFEPKTSHRPENRVGNLPYQRGRLVGRESAIERVVRAVSGSSLVTLHGPAGVGKTSLAIAAANRFARSQFIDGVWLVELANTSPDDEISPMIATALGLQVSTAQTTSSIMTALADQRRLVVLDNCEHVLDGVRTFVEEIGRRCPEIAVLATSREVLGCSGERVVGVAPLGVEDECGCSDAALLFRDQVALLLDDFNPSASDLSTIDKICTQVDGLPLAIELAAARVPAFGLEGVHARLERAIDVLARHRESDTRHGSLRAALSWSYDLLTPPQQLLFERLSVFMGGFDAGAARTVCIDDESSSALDDHLSSLVAQSLINVASHGHPVRYSILEPIRQFGEGLLAARGQRSRMLEVHSNHVLAWSARAARGTRGPDELAWHQQYVAEWSNLREALNNLIDADDAEAASRLISNVSLWAKERMMLEIGEWAERVLAMPSASDAPHSSIVAATASVVARTTGRADQANAWFREAHDRHSRLGPIDQPWLLHASSYQVAFGSHSWHASAISDQRDLFGDDPSWWAEFEIFDLLPALTEIAIRQVEDATVEAVLGRFEHLRHIAREIANPTLRARVDAWYGSALRTLRPERAHELLVAALATAEELDAKRLVYQIDMDLGPVFARLDRPTDALEHLRPRIERFMRAGAIEQARSDAIASLPALAALGCHELAALAIGHLEQHFSPRWIRYLVGDELVPSVRDVLGGPATDQFRQLGASLDASAVVAHVVASIDTLIG